MSGPQAEGWAIAAKKEYNQFFERGTWDPEPVDLPPGRDPLGLKWVFKTKYTADNKIEHLKGRLVVQGYAQTEGLDYLETFAPVVNMVSNRAIYAKVAKYDL